MGKVSIKVVNYLITNNNQAFDHVVQGGSYQIQKVRQEIRDTLLSPHGHLMVCIRDYCVPRFEDWRGMNNVIWEEHIKIPLGILVYNAGCRGAYTTNIGTRYSDNTYDLQVYSCDDTANHYDGQLICTIHSDDILD